MKKYFLDLIITFEDYLAPSIAWKLKPDALQRIKIQEAAEALSKMNVE